MAAGISFPLILNLYFGNTNPVLSVFSIVVSVLLIITHRKNIRRILKKEESKVQLFASRK
jgi:glycerol-3-phosphate acyltransferase PlsY